MSRIQFAKGAAILSDVSECQAMLDKIEVLEDIEVAETQIEKGLELSHQEMKKRFAKTKAKK
ncbi:MAG: hypothetical protein HYZ10_14480 [Ignavibacteriales bacterium]|nr:hypothetical protein [Ignavibacteriales bacterium]